VRSGMQGVVRELQVERIVVAAVVAVGTVVHIVVVVVVAAVAGTVAHTAVAAAAVLPPHDPGIDIAGSRMREYGSMEEGT
jgi:hypothetical protein